MIDLKAVTVKETKIAPRQGSRAKRDLGPNVFLDPSWSGNLKSSYDQAKAFEITVPGKIENKPLVKGENKGKVVERVTGDAADATTLLRDAAAKLGIGVAIRYRVARNGFLAISYQGQKRKQKRQNTQVPA